MSALGEGPEVLSGAWWHEGEVYPMPDRVVVATMWGHVEPGPYEEGQRVRRGATLARVSDGVSTFEVTAPVAGTLAGWFVRAGDPVDRGAPLLSIRRLPERKRRRP